MLGPSIARLLRPHAAVLVGWMVLVVVAATMLLLHETHPFPGWVAALPVLGAAAVIGAGPVAGSRGPVAVLRSAPMQLVGKLSYSLYLWHWPVMVFATALLLDRPGRLEPAVGLAMVALSVVPAWLSFRLVEEPLRQRRSTAGDLRRWWLKVGALCTALSLTAGLALVCLATLWERDTVAAAAVPSERSHLVQTPADLRRAGSWTTRARSPRPPPTPARTSRVATPTDVTSRTTRHRKPSDARTATPQGTTPWALLGDSHAAQWVPTFRAMAEQRHWRLLVYTKSGCPLVDATVSLGKDDRPYTACTEWNDDVQRIMTKEKPDLVVTSAADYRVTEGDTLLDQERSDARMVKGLRSSWARLEATGAVVVPIADTPRPGFDIADCVSANEGALRRCGFPRSRALGLASHTVSSAASNQASVHLVNVEDYIARTPCARPSSATCWSTATRITSRPPTPGRSPMR